MDEKPLSDEEFRELHRILQQAALAAYPNPDRKGCPGTEVLKAVARTPWPANHPGYDHVKHCSPCLREMLDLQQETALARIRKRYRIYRIGIAAVLVLAAAIGFTTWRSFGIRDQHLQAAMLNFATSINRGLGSDQRTVPDAVQVYPRKVLLITMSLPLGSEDGSYDFQVVSRNETTLIQAQTKAHIANGLTTITQKVDLSGLEPGLYLARVKHPPFGQWREVPIRVE